MNRKIKAKHHTKQNNKTLNTLNATLTHTSTTHESIKQLNIKHESLAIMNLWTLLPGNGAKLIEAVPESNQHENAVTRK